MHSPQNTYVSLLVVWPAFGVKFPHPAPTAHYLALTLSFWMKPRMSCTPEHTQTIHLFVVFTERSQCQFTAMAGWTELPTRCCSLQRVGALSDNGHSGVLCPMKPPRGEPVAVIVNNTTAPSRIAVFFLSLSESYFTQTSQVTYIHGAVTSMRRLHV